MQAINLRVLINNRISMHAGASIQERRESTQDARADALALDISWQRTAEPVASPAGSGGMLSGDRGVLLRIDLGVLFVSISTDRRPVAGIEDGSAGGSCQSA